MCTYFSCWISFFAGYTLSFIFVFPMQLKRKCSQITHMQNEWEGGSREQRQKIGLLVPTRLRLPFRLRLIFRLWKLWASATLVFWLCLKTPPIRARPPAAAPFLIPSRFCGKLALTCGSSSVTIERQRNQSREEAIKAYDFIQRKRAARTSWKNAFFGKRTSCLSEKLLGKYLERYILYKPYWRISI